MNNRSTTKYISFNISEYDKNRTKTDFKEMRYFIFLFYSGECNIKHLCFKNAFFLKKFIFRFYFLFSYNIAHCVDLVDCLRTFNAIALIKYMCTFKYFVCVCAFNVPYNPFRHV